MKTDTEKKTTKGEVYSRMEANGTILTYEALEPIRKMISPVICNNCGKIYDECGVKVEHRFSDCDQFYTPCCNKLADNRAWKSFPDFKKFDPTGFRLVA